MGLGKDDFLQRAQALFELACESVVKSGPGPVGVPPMVLPFPAKAPTDQSGEQPGELLTFRADDEDEANRMARETISGHAADWTGYLYVRHAVVTVRGEQNNAIVLEGWWRSVATHMVRRYRAFDDGTLTFLEPPTMVSERPANRLLAARTRVTATQARALRDEVLDFARRCRPGALTGDLSTDWPERIQAIALSDADADVPVHDWAWCRRQLHRLETLLSLKAPAVVVDHDLNQVVSRLTALFAVSPAVSDS